MKFDLLISPPYLNAPGTLGYVPPAANAALPALGAFVTNPLSLEARTPAHGVRWLDYPGGFLLHTGHPNPGLRAAIKRYGDVWRRAARPVIVHLLAQSAGEVRHMAALLERVPGLGGLELGLPPDVGADEALAMVRALAGELALIVRLPYERAAEIGAAILRPGLDELPYLAAFSLSAPRGLLPVGDGQREAGGQGTGDQIPAGQSSVGQGTGSLRSGRLYGPALLPLTLAALPRLLALGLPVIAGAGVYTQQQAQTVLAAGALAVQLDAVLWRGGFEAPVNAQK